MSHKVRPATTSTVSRNVDHNYFNDLSEGDLGKSHYCSWKALLLENKATHSFFLTSEYLLISGYCQDIQVMAATSIYRYAASSFGRQALVSVQRASSSLRPKPSMAAALASNSVSARFFSTSGDDNNSKLRNIGISAHIDR